MLRVTIYVFILHSIKISYESIEKYIDGYNLKKKKQ